MIFQKLRTRMIVHIIWIVAAVVIVTFIFVYKLHEKSTQYHLQRDAAVTIGIFKDILLNAMRHKEPFVLHNFLLDLSRLEHIKTIRIVRPNGRIAFSSFVKENNELIKQSIFNDFLAQPKDNFEHHFHEGNNATFLKMSKIKNEQSCQQCHNPSQSVTGILWVETSATLSITALKSDYLVFGGIAFGVIVLLSLATVVLFIQSIDRPVQQLRATMNTIKQGDFTTRMKPSRQDELGQLTLGINEMAEKLQKTRSQLLEHHRQEILQAESLAKIGEMAAGMAHEIKNPISGIVFAVNSILRDTELSDNRKEIFEEIVEQAHRVEQNLEALLTFARHTHLEPIPTNLNAIVERILLFVSQQTDMKLIIVENELDENLPEIMADPKQIEKVMLNLIINAVQAMPNGGQLTVSTRNHVANNKVSLTVRDSGLGVPEKLQDKIFQPFYTTKANGTGLGLTLSKEIVIRHSGTIFFNSGQDLGTTFTVELPIRSLETL